MKSGYRKLGEFIQAVDIRNEDLSVTHLLGVGIEKKFIESIANTIGTDFRNYKIVKKGQFAYGPVTSRNGEKISIALLKEDECIISSSYSVFEVTDTNKLLPEYLMLWFSRAEFDRYARYKSQGSVREIFDWEEMCNVELPVPALPEQQKIVNAYNAIERRIQIKRKINEKLLELGSLIISKNIGTGVYLNSTVSEIEEAKKNIAESWKIIKIQDFCNRMESGSTPSRNENLYWKNATVPWLKSGEVHNNITLDTEEYITEKALAETSTKLLPKNTILMAMYGVTAGEVGYLDIEATTNQAVCGMICKNTIGAAYLYFLLIMNQEKISSMANGGAQNNLSKNFIENILIVVPEKSVLDKMNLNILINNQKKNYREIKQLQKLQQLLVSRIAEK